MYRSQVVVALLCNICQKYGIEFEIFVLFRNVYFEIIFISIRFLVLCCSYETSSWLYSLLVFIKNYDRSYHIPI